MQKRFFLVFLFLLSQITGMGVELGFEGFFPNHSNDRLLIVSLFLPYNPSVIIYGNPFQAVLECKEKWMKGSYIELNEGEQRYPCDFLWIDGEVNEWSIIKQYSSRPELKVIYTSMPFGHDHRKYKEFIKYLNSHGFVLLSHWYKSEEKGRAIFLKDEIFNSAMRSWNYTPTGNVHSIPVEDFIELEKFFKKAEEKQCRCPIEGIDFVYMINLDERPEKFALTNHELNHFDIYPYRFSAVNGWELPVDTLRKIGVPFSKEMTSERLMGRVYKKVDNEEVKSNEFIEKEGEIYFSLGLTHGAIGCILSHLSVLQDAFDSGYKTIWIMEDDVEILQDPSCIDSLIHGLNDIDPDWDVLFTDPDTKNSEGEFIVCRSLAARPNLAIPPLSHFLKKFYPVSQDLSRTGMRYGTYSMIIRQSGIKKILKHFKKYGIFLPYDMDYWLIPDLKMYCPNQAVISHRPRSLTDNGRPNYASAL